MGTSSSLLTALFDASVFGKSHALMPAMMRALTVRAVDVKRFIEIPVLLEFNFNQAGDLWSESVMCRCV